MLALGLLCLCCFLASGLIMPMQNSNGDPDVSSIIHHVSALEKTFIGFQSQFQANTIELENVKAQLRVTENKLQTASDELVVVKTKLTSLEKTSNVSRIIHELQTDVSFEVTLASTTPALGLLKFDTVTTNLGNAYDPGTGMFHVPVAGTYLFWAHVRVLSNHHRRSPDKPHGHHFIKLMSSSGVLATGYGFNDDDKQDAISITHLAHLEQGTSVYLDMNETTSNSHMMGLGASSYGGTLLRLH